MVLFLGIFSISDSNDVVLTSGAEFDLVLGFVVLVMLLFTCGFSISDNLGILEIGGMTFPFLLRLFWINSNLGLVACVGAIGLYVLVQLLLARLTPLASLLNSLLIGWLRLFITGVLSSTGTCLSLPSSDAVIDRDPGPGPGVVPEILVPRDQ